MQRVNEFVFYELAVKVHNLTDLPQEGVKYSQVWYVWNSAREALNEIYQQRPLNFTTAAANALYQAITAVVPENFQEMIAKIPNEVGTDEDIRPWMVQKVRNAAIEFETVLRNECYMMDTYFVTKKGAYSTVDLVEHAHYQVPEPTRKGLPDLTKKDLDQAGKCIAFDVPTAAAFHLLRGTELVIREYYDLVVPGEKKASRKLRNWGAYIRLLKSHGADETVTSLLSHLKDVYRNPVFHPEEDYTDEKVQVLFGVCISAIVSIKAAIAKIKNTTKPLEFPAGASGTLAEMA